jgi:hypothetical protein
MPAPKSKYGNFFSFNKEEIFVNRIEAYPDVRFFVYSGSVYYNDENQQENNSHTPQGCINLYDLNVSRNKLAAGGSNQLIYPFVPKKGSLSSFKTITTEEFNSDFTFGDILSGSYPLTATISVDRYDATDASGKTRVLHALRNALNSYGKHSEHYFYSSSFANKETQPLNLISIPSIFYGSSIKKGSIKLKYYITGSLLAEASDIHKNGELIQTSGSETGNGKCVGVAMYGEGFILLTSSLNLVGPGPAQHSERYSPLISGSTADVAYSPASWQYFAATGSVHGVPSSSFSIDFKGTSYVSTLTMFAHARKNSLNYSNNPTFLMTGSIAYASGSKFYREPTKIEIKNIVSSSYLDYTGAFEPVTYISKIGIYDKNKNLIAIAGLANPVRKREKDDFTFKLKLDI